MGFAVTDTALLKKTGGLDSIALSISRNTAQTLAALAQKPVRIRSVKAGIMLADDALESISQSPLIGAYVKIIGPIKGAVVVMFSPKSAAQFADMLLQKNSGTTKVIGRMEMSALSEACNIISASCLTGLGKEFGFLLFQSTPRFTSTSTLAATGNLKSYFDAQLPITVVEAEFEVGNGTCGMLKVVYDGSMAKMVAGI